ncbi:hypothetical protein Q7P35_000194 [Cladosporium inversicolor]
MAGKQSTAFTARETELLTIAFQCIKEKPVEEEGDENTSPTKKKKATPGKAKGKKKAVADAEGGRGRHDCCQV